MTFIRRGIIICVLLIIWNSIQDVHSKGLIEVFQWKQMDYYNRGDSVSGTIHNSGSSLKRPINIPPGGIIFPDQLAHINRNRGTRDIEKVTSRDNPITTNSRWGYDNPRNNTSYIPYNNVPMGATHFNGRLFVTMPRRRTGIPSTLNYIDLQKDGNDPSPKLRAYPDFETNYLNPTFEPNPNRLISVYRTSVDACNRLWFIDTGMLEYPDNRMQIQRPSIWVIDLLTDRVVHRSEIPESIAETGRGLASITVDVSKQHCDKAFAYIPDLLYSQLYVYSLENDRIWSFSHNYFNFDPVAGDLSIGGENFRWDDGIFSVTLGPMQPNGQRPVFFHAMASNNEFVVSNAVLQNEENANRSDHGDDFQLLGSRGFKKQSTMHEYDPRTGVIFYDEIQRDGVGCWNTNQPFAPDAHDTVASDPARMIYPSDLSIDDQGTMWVMTNSMPIFIYSQLDPNVVNFRVWKQNVYKAIENTKCQN